MSCGLYLNKSIPNIHGRSGVKFPNVSNYYARPLIDSDYTMNINDNTGLIFIYKEEHELQQMTFVCNNKYVIYVNNETFECQKFIYKFFTIPLNGFRFDINGGDLLDYLTSEIILDNRQINENIFFNPIISSHGLKKLNIHLNKYRKVEQPAHVTLVENNFVAIIITICVLLFILFIGCIIKCCVDVFKSACSPCTKTTLEVNAEMNSVSFNKKLEEAQIMFTKISTIKDNLDKEISNETMKYPSTSATTFASTPNIHMNTEIEPMLPEGTTSKPNKSTLENEKKLVMATIEQPLSSNASKRKSFTDLMGSTFQIPWRTYYQARKERHKLEDNIG